MRRVALVTITLAGACTFEPGRLAGGAGSDAAPGPPDARPGSPDAMDAVPADAAPIDAAGPAVRCDFASLVAGQILLPELVANINTPETDRDPFVTADGTTLFLMSQRPGGQGEDVWMATRADTSSDFSTPVNATELNSSVADTRVSLTADALTLVLSSVRAGPDFDIYVSERQSAGAPFPAPTLLAGVDSGDNEFDPVISLDGLRLYVSVVGAGGNQDIRMGQRGARDGTFSLPQPLAVINTEQNEADPAFTADELLIVFARGDDIHYATRASKDQDFSAPQPLTAINTPFREADPFVTADGCELYFASERPSGQGNLDIYRVRLEPP